MARVKQSQTEGDKNENQENKPNKNTKRIINEVEGDRIHIKERDHKTLIIIVLATLLILSTGWYILTIHSRVKELESLIDEQNKSIFQMKIDHLSELKSNEIKLKEEHNRFVEELHRKHYSELDKYKEKTRVLSNEKDILNSTYKKLKEAYDYLQENVKKFYDGFQNSLQINLKPSCGLFDVFGKWYQNSKEFLGL